MVPVYASMLEEGDAFSFQEEGFAVIHGIVKKVNIEDNKIVVIYYDTDCFDEIDFIVLDEDIQVELES